MKKLVLDTIKHPLISGSIVIFSGTFLANILNFLFNLFMASNMTLADYGILASVISLMTLPAYAGSSINPIIVQFAGKYFADKDFRSINSLYGKIGKTLFFCGLLFFIIFLISINHISEFFKISDVLLLFATNILIFIGYFSVINNSLLQAKLSFTFLSFNGLFGSLIKLLLGVMLIMLGFGVRGAFGAIFISTVIPFLLTFLPLRFLFKKMSKKVSVSTNELMIYGIPTSLALLGLTSLITTDILLVKHFLEPSTAGMYAGLSLAGRIIFFFTAPISSVMFPIIVQKYNKNEDYANTFFLAFLSVLCASLAITVIYFLLPQFVIFTIFRRSEYLAVAPLAGLFGVFITFYSLISVIVNFYLSIRKTLVFIPVSIAAVLQVLFITIYHQSMLQIVQVSTVVSFLLLLVLLLYYPYATKKS